MTDSPAVAPDAAPAADPGPRPAPPLGRPGPWQRFFSWVSGFGIARGDGWIGGVCSGIAARLGIDPVIVRGVVVVAALFGLPVFLVYAIAWAVLPDLSGRIHLRDLLDRRFDPAMIGIGLMAFVGLFPVVPWFTGAVLPFGFFGYSAWDSGWNLLPTWLSTAIGTTLAVAVIGGIIFLIVRAATTRTPQSGETPVSDLRTASAASTTPGSPAELQDDSGVPAAAAAADPAVPDAISSHAMTGSALTPPVAPESGASDAEFAAWREQHAAWRVQDDAWRRQQQDAERAAREQARRERADAGASFAAEAAERRRLRRASKPRTSFAFVAFVTGAALVTGAATSLWQSAVAPDEVGLAVATGLFAAALVVAIAMIVAGALRRRSGFLAFVTAALLIAASITGAVHLTRGIVYGSAYVNNIEPPATGFTQMWGSLTIDVADTGEVTEPIVIDKRAGSTDVWVGAGVLLDLSVTGAESVEWVRYDATTGETTDQGTWKSTTNADGDSFVRERIDNREETGADRGTTQAVTLDQHSGTVYVTINEF